MLAEIAEIRKEFARESLRYKGHNAFLGVVYNKDGKEYKYKQFGPGPCHGNFSKSSVYSYTSNTLTGVDWKALSAVQPLQTSKEGALNFFDYLFNRSPFAEVFITKDPVDAMKNGIVANTDLPENLVLSAFVASRFPTESYVKDMKERFRVWEEIKAFGFSENFAFIFSQVFKFTNTKKYEVIYMPHTSGHCTFEYNNASEAYYHNFINNTPVKLSDKTFKENGGYGGRSFSGTGIWQTKGDDGAFSRWMKGLKPITFDKAVNYNIFEKAPDAGVVITSAEGFKNVLEQIQERLKSAA